MRAKRSLAGIPGGGGTPLAAGIDAALALAEPIRRKGETPILILLTDGRANVARDGSGGRERAESDALAPRAGCGRQADRAGARHLRPPRTGGPPPRRCHGRTLSAAAEGGCGRHFPTVRAAAAGALAPPMRRPRWEMEGRTLAQPGGQQLRAGRRIALARPADGQGPELLLVHGTGAATHSWRGLAPLLARHFTILAPDLPGHGFTDPLPATACRCRAWRRRWAGCSTKLEFKPELVVGHSAGAAILARMCLDRLITPKTLVSLNGAFLPFRGVPGHLFMPLAKLLVRQSAGTPHFLLDR